jgi:hypothetical protein
MKYDKAVYILFTTVTKKCTLELQEWFVNDQASFNTVSKYSNV